MIWFELSPLGFTTKRRDSQAFSLFLCTRLATQPAGSRAALRRVFVQASHPAGVTYENRSHWLPFLFLSGWDIEQLWRLAFGCESSQLDHNPETSIKGKINVY